MKVNKNEWVIELLKYLEGAIVDYRFYQPCKNDFTVCVVSLGDDLYFSGDNGENTTDDLYQNKVNSLENAIEKIIDAFIETAKEDGLEFDED